MQTYCAKYYIDNDTPRCKIFATEREANIFIETMRAYYSQKGIYFAYDICEATK